MEDWRLYRRGWLAPVGIALIGVALSCLAFWVADRADERRVRNVLAFRSEWRARDIEAKIRLSGNAVESVAIAMAANPALTADQFGRVAARAAAGLAHVNALEWAPRIRREDIPAFEAAARAQGLKDYRVFDVTPDFHRTELADRPEYFPVLYDERFHGARRAQGLALGRYDGRRIPMEKAASEGLPIATLPVRPIGPRAEGLIYLLYWPVYDTIEAPGSAERAQRLRGYAIGNYDLAPLLTAVLRNTPEIIETLRFTISARHQPLAAEQSEAVYTPTTRSVRLMSRGDAKEPEPAVRVVRDFEVFDQHWDLTFDFPPTAVATLRSPNAWGWLVAGLLLTASLIVYLLRERGRTRAIEGLVAERTAELQRTSEQLNQAQKMEAIGNMTGGMAHDFNNLLSVVIGNLDLLDDRLKGDDDAAKLADTALQAALRGADLTRQLLAFARRQPLHPRLIDVNALVTDATRLLKRILQENIEITLITAPDLWPVVIDPTQLNSAIVNLANNARDAMPNGGRLTIETKNSQLDADYAALNPDVVPGEFVLIEVSDSGIGMSAETVSHVFEPFYTTKEVGRGTGLGLSMVFGFVKQSQGHVKIYSELGQGTTVRLYLPRAKGTGAVAETRAAPAPAVPERRHGTILLVEDNGEVRRTVTGQLLSFGYTVIEADSAAAALALLEQPETAVDLLFTDIVMPGGRNGHELAAAAQAIRPDLKVLLTSGYSGSALRNGNLIDGAHFLSKPYRRDELARKLDEVLER
ncbi:MAG: CHASE domain-containing protein [Candidatus Eiseniibacteriota bacterium]